MKTDTEEDFMIEHDLFKNRGDWPHMNAVYHDPRDDTLVISGRNQGTVKTDGFAYPREVQLGLANVDGAGRSIGRGGSTGPSVVTISIPTLSETWTCRKSRITVSADPKARGRGNIDILYRAERLSLYPLVAEP